MSEVNLEEWVLVDTDVFSFLMSDTSKYKNLYLPHVNGKRVAVAFITVGELYFGAKRKNWGENRIADLKHRLGKVTIVPFDDGRLQGLRRHQGPHGREG